MQRLEKILLAGLLLVFLAFAWASAAQWIERNRNTREAIVSGNAFIESAQWQGRPLKDVAAGVYEHLQEEHPEALVAARLELVEVGEANPPVLVNAKDGGDGVPLTLSLVSPPDEAAEPGRESPEAGQASLIPE